MTSTLKGRHRKAARPLTPLVSAPRMARRGLAVAASSGLALTMIASGASATSQSAENASASAGTLKAGITAEAAKAATQNAAITVPKDAKADADVTAATSVAKTEDTARIEAERRAAEEAARQRAAEEAARQQAEAQPAAAETPAAAASTQAATSSQSSTANQAAASTQAATSSQSSTTSQAAAPAQAATSSQSSTTSQAATPTVAGSSVGAAIAATALQYQGVPYVWGGTTPSGWDCSGFVQWVYAQHGISLPRTSYAQGAAGTAVSAAQAQPGDIVYYGGHVGIYIGDGKMVDAGNPRVGTSYRAVYGTPQYYVRVA